MGANWTEEECNFLEDKWGTISIPTIAKSLGRTEIAVKIKAHKLGLGRHLYSCEEITISQLVKVLGAHYTWAVDKWISYGFPVKYKKSVSKKYKVFKLEDFWKWAEQHRDILDFSKFEKGMLGIEPGWVKDKREADIAAAKYIKTPWTEEEDNMLMNMLNSYKYSYQDISDRLKRTGGAIKRRMVDLRLKQRPLKADNHNPWTNEEIKILLNLRHKGFGPEVIAKKLGGKRSSLAVRGKLERMGLIGGNGESRTVISTRH
ncbi:hypothetical protein [Clostridium pasteurianum]|uniref:HTH myb-type domain-containing protein n=1 Tax=Clostridium pasteurianum BC1 TaxID=86416 RepID=R4KA12_CLOPA|nr:hypothetical protein [Clostridium pasteurianum]AGK97384.1 hypothetical protein Clopa_2524 [Clostridium pasteurianum BC1]